MQLHLCLTSRQNVTTVAKMDTSKDIARSKFNQDVATQRVIYFEEVIHLEVKEARIEEEDTLLTDTRIIKVRIKHIQGTITINKGEENM